ncbi:uncharacterized transmembrane protein DDB_G0289901-like isoform X2 [Bradysia coprophila]|uniref:uncharacterized transmembrane protein DDB_G0289901-like isoform X2 n=1 Tax=Bradysia coprophila TaxID=38358 RepID=UPI00187DD06B|nr:uncharacterized transmembrane protein DDB_G0289901-like isoform X2 [Bradysia coprophila]
MIVKQRRLIVCTISIIFLLIVQHCDAARSSGSRKSSSGRGSTSGRGTSTGNSGNSGSSGSWWSRVTGGGSSSSSSKVSSSATQKKPEPSAPRYEEKKPIGWNVQGVNNNPGAPPPYSNTHTKGLSNPSLQNAPPYSKNSPPGHQTIQSNNNPNQYQGLNYPRNTGQQSAGYPVQSNVQGQYPGINYPKNAGQQQSGYPGGAYQGGHYPNQGGHYPNQGGYYPNQGGYHPNQGGHYSGMNYGGGAYPGYSGYSPAAPNGYFASGYPVGIVSGNSGRSGSGSTLTNALLAGTVGLGLYNAIRPYPSYSGSNYGGYGGGAGGGSTIHNHYYNNQAPGSNPNSAQAPVQAPAQAPAQATPSNQNTNVDQTPLAPMPGQAGIPLANNNSADPANALVTPPPPALAINEKITNLDCAMNCSEISQCPQEWRYPCLNRTISKEYFDGITLPPPPSPPPMPQAKQITPEKFADPRDMTDLHQNKNEDRNSTVYLAHSQQMAIVSSSSSSTRASVSTGCSLCFVIFFGMAVLKSSLQLKF